MKVNVERVDVGGICLWGTDDEWSTEELQRVHQSAISMIGTRVRVPFRKLPGEWSGYVTEWQGQIETL